VAKAAIDGPMTIATAISPAALAMSLVMLKTSSAQLATPKAKTARTMAIMMPMMLMTSSFRVFAAFVAIFKPVE